MLYLKHPHAIDCVRSPVPQAGQGMGAGMVLS